MGNCESSIKQNNDKFKNVPNISSVIIVNKSNKSEKQTEKKFVLKKNQHIDFSFVDEKIASEINDCSMLLKIVLTGDSKTGKSSFLTRILKNEFNIETKSTIGVEFGRKIVNINGTNICIQIWDTAGQERFRAITSAYYRGAHGVIVLYDISSRSSFDNVDKWVNEIRNHVPDVNIVLVANKIDLDRMRVISMEEGLEKSKLLNATFMESSAMVSTGVKEIFMELIISIIKKSNY